MLNYCFLFFIHNSSFCIAFPSQSHRWFQVYFDRERNSDVYLQDILCHNPTAGFRSILIKIESFHRFGSCDDSRNPTAGFRSILIKIHADIPSQLQLGRNPTAGFRSILIKASNLFGKRLSQSRNPTAGFRSILMKNFAINFQYQKASRNPTAGFRSILMAASGRL